MNEYENRPVPMNFTENIKRLFRKYSVLRLFAWVEGLSIFFGFITLLPGKNNHIKEFPSIDAILHRLTLAIVIPLICMVVYVGILYFSEFGNPKKD